MDLLTASLLCSVFAAATSNHVTNKLFVQIPVTSEGAAASSPFDIHNSLRIFSDGLLWFSYFMMAAVLVYLLYSKKTEPLPFKSVIVLFVLFFLGCGITHLMDVVAFWRPAFGLITVIRSLTAIVSLITVFALMRVLTKVRDMKSPSALEKIVEQRTKELTDLKSEFQREIVQRNQVEQKLTTAYRDLAEKTSGLEDINRQLIKREHDLIKSEQLVKQLNQGLEKQVQSRTAELQSANRELEAFTYSVSHDLRAPLRAIDGYARILEEDYNPRIDSHGKHLLKVSTKNAKYMGQLIDDLLEFSRTSRLAPVKTIFETSEEVRRIIGELMQNEKDRPVEIHVAEMANCEGDHAMLKQIWVNLISNALKYTRKNPAARIEIGCEAREHEIVYFIKDNGVGFEMEYVDKLFGVFQRLHRKEEFEGTGVGLALVKRILERHQGQIWAQAAVGKGAAFFFTLPKYL
jgi:signal transduction histidine kinase